MRVISNAMQKLIAGYLRNIIDINAVKYGYKLQRTGGDYIDAQSTIDAAAASKMSIYEYLYRNENEEKKSRIDRIMNNITSYFKTEESIFVVEIGAGTGMYMERMFEILNCQNYHAYETNIGWRNYLSNKFANKIGCLIPDCDGITLKSTPTNSANLITAHGVFVYTPALITFSYISDTSRVLKSGSYLIFDCFLDTNFGCHELKKWNDSEHRFPIITSEKLLREKLSEIDMELIDVFRELYGPDYCDYVVCRKI